MGSKERDHIWVEFEEHIVITTAIRSTGLDINYMQNKLFEKGVFVSVKFEYHSGKNPHFLSIKELVSLDTEDF